MLREHDSYSLPELETVPFEQALAHFTHDFSSFSDVHVSKLHAFMEHMNIRGIIESYANGNLPEEN